ncbi:phage baseplate assembly protein V [Enterobacter sp. MF024]|uniref:phage baseplate assembly protein V n=1 Tax=Enterobacter sp. MF024 TaxID=2555644 RepID=UPI001106721E|nr:phage baseplate assembly protein V [Enterobacter sp. MF024]TLU69594.1 phage baseplate assembly protein V [Enterobacter sp. MF024]
MNLNELYRLICNIVRIGTVTEVDLDAEPPVARVSTGENETDWIRWATMRAGTAVTWWAPTPGEQVLLFAPGGGLENAVIMGSLYSASVVPPDNGEESAVILFPDGARISYEPETGALRVTGVKSAYVQAFDSVTVDTRQVTCTATEFITLNTKDMTVNTETMTVNATTEITLNSPTVTCTHLLRTETIEVQEGGELFGDFTHMRGNFMSNSVIVHFHVHEMVQSGKDLSGGPK